MYCMFALPPALYHLRLDVDPLDLLDGYSDRMDFAETSGFSVFSLTTGVRLYIYGVCVVCVIILW